LWCCEVLLLWYLLGPQCNSHAWDVHDLRVRVDSLPPSLLLAHQGLQHSHHLWVVEDTGLPSGSLALCSEEDHQSCLGARVNALLLSSLLLHSRAGRGSGCCCWAWSTFWRWRSSCLDCRNLRLDDVLQVLSKDWILGCELLEL